MDGDHSGGQYAFLYDWGTEESKRFDWAQAQLYHVYPESLSDRLLRAGPWHDWELSLPWADVGGFQQGEGPNYSAVEFCVTAWDDLHWEGPEQSRRSVLEAGKIIGFQIKVGDRDRANAVPANYVFAVSVASAEMAPNARHDLLAENFVDGELIPCHRGDCGSAPPGFSAVRMDSWARIKASFR